MKKMEPFEQSVEIFGSLCKQFREHLKNKAWARLYPEAMFILVLLVYCKNNYNNNFKFLIESQASTDYIETLITMIEDYNALAFNNSIKGCLEKLIDKFTELGIFNPKQAQAISIKQSL